MNLTQETARATSFSRYDSAPRLWVQTPAPSITTEGILAKQCASLSDKERSIIERFKTYAIGLEQVKANPSMLGKEHMEKNAGKEIRHLFAQLVYNHEQRYGNTRWYSHDGILSWLLANSGWFEKTLNARKEIEAVISAAKHATNVKGAKNRMADDQNRKNISSSVGKKWSEADYIKKQAETRSSNRYKLNKSNGAKKMWGKAEYRIKRGFTSYLRPVFEHSDGPDDWAVFTPQYLKKVPLGRLNLFDAITAAYPGEDWYKETLPRLLNGQAMRMSATKAHKLAERVRLFAEFADKVNPAIKREYDAGLHHTNHNRIRIEKVGTEWCLVSNSSQNRTYARLPILGGLYLRLYQDMEGRFYRADESAVRRKDPLLLEAIENRYGNLAELQNLIRRANGVAGLILPFSEWEKNNSGNGNSWNGNSKKSP